MGQDELLSKDDIKRELCIMHQAQAAVIEAYPRLKKLNIPVERPSDYFAQMSKTDVHMIKIREKMQKRKFEIEEKQRLRQLRQLKKMGKKTQIMVEQQKATEKRELGDLVKKNKKGDKHSLEQIKAKIEHKSSSMKPKSNKQKKRKRDAKDKRYGSGGIKRGMKRNTAQSSAANTSTKGKRGTFNKSKKSFKSKRK